MSATDLAHDDDDDDDDDDVPVFDPMGDGPLFLLTLLVVMVILFSFILKYFIRWVTDPFSCLFCLFSWL